MPHSPGPWIAKGPDQFDEWVVISKSPENASAVCTMISSDRTPDTIKANARLTAAAPSLFNAVMAWEAGDSNADVYLRKALAEAKSET